jgi:hypothetical protein
MMSGLSFWHFLMFCFDVKKKVLQVRKEKRKEVKKKEGKKKWLINTKNYKKRKKKSKFEIKQKGRSSLAHKRSFSFAYDTENPPLTRFVLNRLLRFNSINPNTGFQGSLVFTVNFVPSWYIQHHYFFIYEGTQANLKQSIL